MKIGIISEPSEKGYAYVKNLAWTPRNFAST